MECEVECEDPFGAESKYAALTALIAFMKEEAWARSVRTHFEKAARLMRGDENDDAGELDHEMFASYQAYQDLVEMRLAAFLEGQSEKLGIVTRYDLFDQLAAASQSDDMYSASEVQALIERCTSFAMFLEVP